MAEILSQSEIDELLNALATGDADLTKEPTAPEQTVREYNFEIADKVSREQVRTLRGVFDSYAQIISNLFVASLRTICSVELVSVDELTFREFSSSLPEPVLLAVMTIEPLEGSAMMIFTSTIVYAIINHLFGGSDETANTSKNFSEIEVAAMTRIINQLLRRMGEAWDRILDNAEAKLERVETSAQFAQICGPNDHMVIITMSVRIGKTSDIITIGIPYMALESIAQQLSRRQIISGSARREIVPQTEVIHKQIINTQVSLQAVFNTTTATVGEVLALQPGDVIQLEHLVNEALAVKVEHIPKFHGFIGTLGSKYALRVSEVIREESEDE